MDILYLCSGRGFSSSRLPRKIDEVVKCFAKTGHNILLVCGEDIEQKENIILSDIRKLNSRSFSNNILAPIYNSISEIRDLIHDNKLYDYLRDKLKCNRLLLIWERSSRLHLSGLRLAKKMNIPYVLEWKDHLINYNYSLLKKVAILAEKKKEANADFIVVESNKLKNIFTQNGLDENKVFVAYNAVDTDEFKPDMKKRNEFRNRMAINDKEIAIGYIGSFSFYQDSLRMILAMEKLKKLRFIKLILFGYGPDYEKCKYLAKKLELLNNSIFMFGEADKKLVPFLVNAFDIGIVPGTTDIICPIKVFEYMATGIPVLLPDYECNREVITEGIDGLFFKPRDENDMAKRILQLSHDENMRKMMGAAARQKVLENFTWEKTWAKTLINILECWHRLNRIR